MKNKTKKIGLVLIVAMFLTPLLASNAIAEEYNVTVRWVIPSDYTLSISYPSGETEIKFTPSGMNFTAEEPVGQTASVRAMNITNTGNADVYVRANFTAAFPTGVTTFNLTTTHGTPNEWFWVGASNETAQHVIASALSMGSHQGYYAFSSGTEVAFQNTTKTLRLISAGS